MTREEAIAILQEKYDYCKSFYDLAARPKEDYAETAQYLQALQVALTALRGPTREQVERMRGEWIHDGPNFEGWFDGNASYYEYFLLDRMANYCVGYKHTEYNGRHYYMMYHS